MQPALAARAARRRADAVAGAGRRQPRARRRDARRRRERRPGAAGRVRRRPVRRDRAVRPAGWPAASGTAPRPCSTSSSRWLAANPRRLVAIEQDFLVELADPDAPGRDQGPGRPARARRAGPARRRRPEDRQVHPANADLAEHPQLGGLPGGGRAGAFDESRHVSGGAALVQLGGADKRRPRAGPAAAGRRPATQLGAGAWSEDGEGMAASTFDAVVNNQCRGCPVTALLPGLRQGRQVTYAVTARPPSPTTVGAAPSQPLRTALHPGRAGRLLRQPPPTPRAGRRDRRRRSSRWSSWPAPGRARPRRWPPGSSGWSPTGSSRPEQVLGLTFTRKAAGELDAPGPAAARRSWSAGSAGDDADRRRADGRHLPLLRRPARRRARRADRLRAGHPAAHRGRVLAARRRGRPALGPAT